MMDAATTLQDLAEQALAAMRQAGFHDAQVTAGESALHELNVNHNEPSLLRSNESRKLSLLGIVDARMASTELTDLRPQAVRERIAALFADAAAAPQDDANAVSGEQRATLVKGPQEPDLGVLAAKMRELLEFRARETPRMMVDEADAKHTLVRSHTVTSRGSALSASVGSYSMGVFGTAREGSRSSSFNYTGGAADDLGRAHAVEYFGIESMLRDTEQQIHTEPVGGKFVGAVVLTPNAVADLLAWLLGQLADTQLIAGSSLYRHSVGNPIASALLTVRSRFEASGCMPVSADAHRAPPVELVREGRLLTLTPSLYGSRKTGIAHVPVAPEGWEIAAGELSTAALVRGVKRGAIVGRLSMGMPAANGDFSGVIKNSFVVVDGTRGPALAETMISGNMARMLRDLDGVSSERVDSGALLLPWLRIPGLHFS
jgi:PmbA protein